MKRKTKAPLDLWEDMPKDMVSYLKNNGWHFNRKACEYACSLMIEDETEEKLKPWDRQKVDELLAKYGVKLEDSNNYDYVYICNMCRADLYKTAVPEEKHLAVFIKKVIDDKDACDGHVMRRWYADMVGNGEMIFWEEFK